MSGKKARGKSVFLTVGTTQFDELIECITKKDILQELRSAGFEDILVQIGNSKIDPPEDSPLKLDYYRFKPSIADDIKNADLVISHAGAGSVLETLKAGKPLIVVVNENLMNNHQYELAEALSEGKHLFYNTCRTLQSTLKEMQLSDLIPFASGNSEIFGAYMNEFMGVR